MKKAFITGVTGQDGSYLAEFLLKKGYEVHGLVRRSSSFNRDRLKDIYKSEANHNANFYLHYGDMTDSSSLSSVLAKVRPDEIYNLAAQSHVRVSFEQPEYTANSDALGLLRLLEAVRLLDLKNVKIYQASTSELFGKTTTEKQNEETPFHPRSPYGVAKLYAFWIAKNYREAYDMYVVNGILFNHESPRRGENFVSRKIVMDVIKLLSNKKKTLSLGNLNAKRDWGHAKDYVESMWLMLQQDKPEDYVVGTGESHSVREFVEDCFAHFDVELEWKGTGLNEKGYDKKTGKLLVDISEKYFRPSEVEYLCADSSKALKKLGWKPKYSYAKLVKDMVSSELKNNNLEVEDLK